MLPLTTAVLRSSATGSHEALCTLPSLSQFYGCMTSLMKESICLKAGGGGGPRLAFGWNHSLIQITHDRTIRGMRARSTLEMHRQER